MAKRTLKRQLNLFQVIMLGTAGTLGSGIFVLTGLAADVAGPATFLAILVGGFLSFSIALNYSELATVYPETGGAMTYVREAWGKGLLSFLVGSMDSISSTFYTALSAVGFAYSLSVFFPSIPIIPVAIAAIIVFVILNILGVTNVGNAQLVMGAGLLFAFAVFIIGGFLSPNGFSMATLFPAGRIFPEVSFLKNTGVLLKTIALIYAAYVGFEVIADDAEEIQNPNKNIPIAILVSLAIITLIYSLVVVVALGTLPWQTLAGSKTALSDTIKVFMPGSFGVTVIAMAGMVGALTSINSSMLSATRESFTLSRDGNWPLVLSRLNRVRVPFMAIIMIGVVSILITIFGVVDFLSYITSAGYLFVLFFSNLAMITLHKKYPDIHRPFKAPLFPLTPILASLTCVIVIFYSDLDAILFTAGVIGLFAIYYYGRLGAQLWQEAHRKRLYPGMSRIIVPIVNTNASNNLIALSAILAQVEMDINICLLSVIPTDLSAEKNIRDKYIEQLNRKRMSTLERFIHYAVERNVPMYTKTVRGASIADAVKNDVEEHRNTKLVLINRPERYLPGHLSKDAARLILDETKTNVAVMVDRKLQKIENITVPVGGGIHSRLAIHLANDIALQEKSHIDFIRILPKERDNDYFEDEMSFLQEIVITELGELPSNAVLRLLFSDDAAQVLVEDVKNNDCDLIITGLSVGYGEPNNLFGRVADQIADNAPCSVLVVKRHESPTMAWLRRQAKRLNR